MTGIQLHNGTAIYPVPAFPVGYIYVSYNSQSPAEMFGGTWEQITNKFLLCAGSTYTAGSTGGASTVTLQTAELPRHRHSGTAYQNSTNNSTSRWEYAAGYNTAFISTTNSVGGGQAHNNMPPYVTVYMWEKIEA